MTSPLHEDDFEPETSTEFRRTPYLMGGVLALLAFVAVIAFLGLVAAWILFDR